jgi:asparagine synthetase B (glutamine-hydrolysing)
VGELAFRFGFLLYPVGTPVDLTAVRDWNRLRVAGFALWAHPEASVRVVHTLGGDVVFIGDVFVAHGSDSIDSIADRVVAGADFDALNQLSGRFAMIVATDSGARVFHDPFGSRTIFYRTRGSRIVASHSLLLAQASAAAMSESMCAYVKSPEHLAKSTRFLPGDLTMFENIVGLPANNYYDFEQGGTFRYWPRGPVPSTSVESFNDLVREYFANYSRFLARTYTPVLGLTGGVDSRAVIAALRSNGMRLRLTTWDRLPADETSVVKTMAAHLGAEHSFMDVSLKSQEPAFERLRTAADINTGLWRGRSYLTAQMGLAARDTDVFVRGLGGEILRGSYHSSQVRYDSADVLEFFLRLYMTGRVKRPSPWYRKVTEEAFRGFMQRSNYAAAAGHVDPGDLVYWEQRMSMWAANLHNETDPAMPSHTGINSRRLYAAAWGLPGPQRFGKTLLRTVTTMFDPEFAAL